MVQVLGPGTQRPTFGQRVGAGVGKGLEIGQQLYQQHQAEQVASSLGIDPRAMRALDPQSRNQILVEGLRRNIAIEQAKKTGGINLQPQQENAQIPETRPSGRGQEFLDEIGQRQKFEVPEFMGGKGKTTQGPGKPSPSMIPQAATTGQKLQVLDPTGVEAEAKRIQAEANAAGQPIDIFDAWQLANQQNEARKSHNVGVEGEQETSRVAQRDYGAIGETALQNAFPEATDEQKAIFQRKAVEAAGRYKDEAKIKHEMALEAKKFKNTLKQVRESIGPKRITSTEKLLGRGRDADAVKTSFRNKLKPLLDEGLYDTARNELSKLGYQPEERETILSDIGEGTRKSLVEMPNMKREKRAAEGSFKKGYFEPGVELNPLNNAQKSIFRNNLEKVFQQDPSTNLVLLRKEYEDKGVDWREFSEGLHELIYNGQIELNPDQFQMLVHIDEPPLNDLEKILHGAKLIGR